MTADEPACAVSFIVPAYNAASTLAQTLASIRAQTFESWEAVIVDDGSRDNSGKIAKKWVRDDARFRLLRQDNAGHSAARNAGIHAARGEWLAFLDSDDWVEPRFLELMTGALRADPALDAVVCGCVYVFPSGEHGAPAIYEAGSLDDAFPAFVLDCPIAIHNCVVRRSLVEAVGGFDTSLKVGEDWDLWQRVARSNPRFGTIPEVLAYYRMRPGTASTKADRALVDGWTVMRRGHEPDPRVPNPVARYADGLAPDGLPTLLYRQAVWAASIRLAQGEDACSLLALMGEQRSPQLTGERVAQWLFEYIPVAGSRPGTDWPLLWPHVREPLTAFVTGLETQAGSKGLAERCDREIRRLVASVTAQPTQAKPQATTLEAHSIPIVEPPRTWLARVADALGRLLRD